MEAHSPTNTLSVTVHVHVRGTCILHVHIYCEGAIFKPKQSHICMLQGRWVFFQIL